MSIAELAQSFDHLLPVNRVPILWEVVDPISGEFWNGTMILIGSGVDIVLSIDLKN